MRLGAAIPVLNEWRFIPAVVGQLLRVVDRCVLVRPSTSQSGAAVELSALPDLDPRIDVLEGNWRGEATTRNAGMEYLSDCDYVFMVDSDEIFLDRDLEILRDLCRRGEHRVISAKLLTYWKTPEYRIDPPEHGTIKVVLQKHVRMMGVREVPGELVHESQALCRHLSYVRTDQEVQEKIRLSGHAHEIRPDWYARAWKGWDENPALENLHPVHPAAYKRAIFKPDPELLAILTRWGCAWDAGERVETLPKGQFSSRPRGERT
jgi:glycosyltransferase involved in cell wall biosynthesis